MVRIAVYKEKWRRRVGWRHGHLLCHAGGLVSLLSGALTTPRFKMSGLDRNFPLVDGLEWWETGLANMQEREGQLIETARGMWVSQRKVILETDKHGSFAFVPLETARSALGKEKNLTSKTTRELEECRQGFAVLQWIAKAGRARVTLLRILRCAGRLGRALIDMKQVENSAIFISNKGKSECFNWLCELLTSAPELNCIPSALALLTPGPAGTSRWLANNKPPLIKDMAMETAMAGPPPFASLMPGMSSTTQSVTKETDAKVLEVWLDELAGPVLSRRGDIGGGVTQMTGLIEEALTVGGLKGQWKWFEKAVLDHMPKEGDKLRGLLCHLSRRVLPELRLLPGALLLIESFCKGVTRAQMKPPRLPAAEYKRTDHGKVVSPVCEAEFRWYFDNFISLTRETLGAETLNVLPPIFSAAKVGAEGERLLKLLREIPQSNKDYEWLRCVEQGKIQDPKNEDKAADLANAIFKVETPRISVSSA